MYPPERLPEILMVDDVGGNLEVLAGVLSCGDWDLAFATGGDDALKQIEAHPPALILLDITMPEIDGFEVCRRLKADEHTRMIPVIFLTAHSAVEDITRGFALGAVDFVSKPFHEKELLARVRTHLELSLARSTISAQNQLLQQNQEALEQRQQDLQQQLVILQGLNQLSLVLQKATSEAQVLDAVRSDLPTLFSALSGEIILMDSKHQPQKSVLRWGDDGFPDAVLDAPPECGSLEQGLNSDAVNGSVGCRLLWGEQTFICLPLRYGREQLGLLRLLIVTSPFVETVVTTAADSIAMALHNIHLHAEERRIQQELAGVNQNLEQLVEQRTLDLSTTNQSLHEEIEEHQRTEKRLRESEQRFRLLVEGVTDYAIFMLDLAGRISSWNAGAQRFKGYTAEEIIGEHISRFYLPEDVSLGLPDQAMEIAQREGRFEGQGWRLRKDGERFWAHVVIDKLRDDDGEVIGYAKITRDITQQRLAQQALNQTMEELMRSNASLEQFAYAASHDLKAPLRNIFSFVQLLEAQYDGERNEETAHCLAFIRDNAERMHALVEGVLEYSRARNDQNGEATVDLNSVVQRACENLAELIRDAGAVIQVGDLPTLLGRDALLLQLFQNLIGNAIKFQPGGRQPQVSICAADGDDHWEVRVADNGIGIEAPHLEGIFGIFHRLHRNVDYPGTGIGLAICKKAVEHHGGSIKVVSTPGQGSTFIIRLAKHLGQDELAWRLRASGEPSA